MAKKKIQIQPVIISSREAAQGVVSEVVKLRLDHAAMTTEMEQEVADVQARFQRHLDELSQQIQGRESGIFHWCNSHKEEFGEKKSIEFATATVGFRTTPPRVEKLLSKDTWGAIAKRLQSLAWGLPFVTIKDPEVNKDALLAQRANLTTAQLKAAGISIAQDENFYIDPKSDVLDASVKKEAA